MLLRITLRIRTDTAPLCPPNFLRYYVTMLPYLILGPKTKEPKVLPLSLKIKGNIITDCKHRGIFFSGGGDNISYNTIRRCNTGISVYCGNNIVYGNDIEDCSVGVISNSLGDGNTITKNNFKNCSLIGCWWERTLQIYLIDGVFKDKKDR